MDLRPEEVRDRLARAGRIAAVRSEQRKAKALTWLLDHVDVVDEDGSPVSREDLKVDDEGDVGTSGEAGEQDSADQVGDATTGEAGT
jgi:hypothetical protein